MFKRIALIFGLMIFTIIFGIFMLLIGMFLGGNFFANFELFGVRGYEAVGNLGLIVGLICGIILSVIIYWRIHTKNKEN